MSAASDDLRPLNGLWVGDRLDYLEQLCLVSGLACGHQVRLFSYEPKQLQGVPAGIEVHDAAEVMPRERMLRYSASGSFALGSNFWRYEMLALDLGYWIDLDVFIVKPLEGHDDYVFGREREGGINTAVLYAPPDSQFVHDLRTLPRANRCPPWFGPRRTLEFHMEKLARGRIELEDFPWGTFGPRMLTYVAKKRGLLRLAAPPEVFYPVGWREAHLLYSSAADIAAILTEKTRAIHLYNSQLRDLTKSPPPMGSYIAQQCERLGIFNKGRGHLAGRGSLSHARMTGVSLLT